VIVVARPARTGHDFPLLRRHWRCYVTTRSQS